MDSMIIAKKFANAVIKAHTSTYEVSCHNDRWMETSCVHCDGSNYSGTLKHKDDCIVLQAERFLKNN
jgi:hypothetical protein